MSTDTMIASTRTAARRFLPAGIREPLGRLCGKFLENVFYPMQGLVFDLSGGRFRVDGCVYIIPKDATRLGFRACFLTKKYEVDERYLIPKHVKSTDSVLELGACLGVVSCITNKLLGNPKRHVVVEGSPFCMPALYRNRALNQCEFLIENCAVGNQKEAVFYMHPAYITGGSMQNPAGIPVRVPGRTLKELCDRHGPFSVLIMDIEGGELPTLQSSLDTLPDFRLVIVELHEWSIGKEGVDKCRAILSQSGFQMIEKSCITEVWVNPKIAD